ncbi:MAG: branched-chain amino acid ABC transporter permease [Candidatus Competibacteraceae bacterium]|nr:branched-chain amino acid ABC transporter permease [Candidatus Competibacteraceae bacterium]MCB1814443.1 branched-chain amino acid ABC transporter permease [Candidatus Competibacteraceae bacterium]
MPYLKNLSLRAWVNGLLVLSLLLLPAVIYASGQIFYQDVATRMIILAIAAVSLNLILGYGGMISFGHAAYMGIGAYCVGIPAYYDIYNGWLHFALAIGAGALFALITGAICLRTKGVYFIMITMAFAQMAFFLFVSLEEYGGDDGLVIYSRSELGSWLDLNDSLTLYYLVLAVLLASVYLSYRLINARFGRVIVGSRSNNRRMQALGFNTYFYRLSCYVIAGGLAGLAGALLGNFTNFISPDMMNWTRSGELIFMVVLGGAGSLFGPLLGATAFLLLEEILSSITIYWQLIFGILLILVVLFGRGGIDGMLGPRKR